MKYFQRGTIRYMSPDILQGFAIGLHDDIYSFGITMWQLKSNADPYHSIPSNEFVAYHVVKNNLRPDSQSKHIGKENGNLKTLQSIGLSTNALNGNVSSACELKVVKPSVRRPLTPITPNAKRMPLAIRSTGHVRRHLRAIPSVSNAVKKLDFNSMSTFSSRSGDRNLSMKELKICTSSKDTNDHDDNNNVAAATLFKDSYQHLSLERKMKIENSYENIYKQCWGQEAAKRPSSPAILELIKSTFHLFD